MSYQAGQVAPVTDDDLLAINLRSWSENSADPDFFQGAALETLLSTCGKAADRITSLSRELEEARRQIAEFNHYADEQARLAKEYVRVQAEGADNLAAALTEARAEIERLREIMRQVAPIMRDEHDRGDGHFSTAEVEAVEAAALTS